MRTIYDIYDKNPIDQKNHILTVSKEALAGDFKNDVKELILYLWENPSIIFALFKNIQNKEEQNKLIYIIMNTFYENIFSINIIDETLFSIIFLLLKDEINQLKKKEEKELFLNDSLCANLLGELARKPEITKYFRKIIEDVVKDINDISNIVNSSISNYVINNKINLNVNEIEEQINQKIIEKEKSEKMIKNRKHNNSFSVPEHFFSMKFKDIRLKSEISLENNNFKNLKGNKNIKEKNNNNENIEDDESLVKKYFDNITKDILIEKQKTIEDIKMKEYLQYQLDNLKEYENNNNINNSEGIYTNQTVLKNIYGSLVSSKILAVYQKNFAIVIKALNKMLKNFLENINELPYNIRQICKIISLLVNKKFPNIKPFERNSFIGIFIIDKILFPLFQDPKINCLITKIDRNEDSYFNYNFIVSLLSDFSLGYFFFETEKNGNYTPFNGYFLEKMPILMEIYDKIIDVEIPKYLEELIENNDKNFNFKENLNLIYQTYFERHKEEQIYNQSCCLSFGDLDFILKLINNYYIKLFEQKDNKLKNIVDKINNNKNYKELLELKIKKEDEHPVMSSDKNTKEKKDINLNCLIKPTVEYFIINNISFSDKLKYILDINLNILYINFKDLDSIQNSKNEDYLNNVLIKSLCETLYSLPYIDDLIKVEKIKKESLNNFQLFINDINNYIIFLSSMESYYQKYTTIEWSSYFLVENINKIKGDYTNYFNEIENYLNSLLIKYDFNELGSCLYDFTYEKTKQEISEISLLKLKKINTNSIVNRIINEFPIYIKIELKEQVTKVKENNKISIHTKLNLDIKRAKSKEKKKLSDSKGIYINEKNNLKIYKTICLFIKYFNLENDSKICQYINDFKEKNKDNQKEKKDIYDYIKHIELPEKIILFINTTLKETISDMLYIEKINKTEIPSILLKTNEKIIKGLFILFREYLPNDKDNELYNKTKLLSWTNINHYINDKYHLYDSIILFIVNCLTKFENKKTVLGKINCISQIKYILLNIQNISKIKYYNESKTGNIYLNPLLIYSIIKFQPKYFYSDIKFISTFIDIDEKNKINNMELIEELKCYIKYILELNYNNLNGNISPEEYNNLCQKASEKIE
jgi:hypothetical protein